VPDRPFVAVVGPGSVGTFFAAHLAAAGCDVLGCARRPFTEWIVDSESRPARAPARVVTDPHDLAVDEMPRFLLLSVKAHQTSSAAAWLARLCGPDTTVVVVQNGVEGVERVSPYTGPARVMPTVVYCGARLVEPGHTAHSRNGLLFVPDGDDGAELASLFAGTGGTIRPTTAFTTEAWRKLGANVVANGLTALTRRGTSIFDEPAMAALAVDLASECFTVARAEGGDLDRSAAEALVDGLKGRDGASSMLYDRLAGRPTEHDALYGAVVRAGVRHDIPTPLAAAIGAIVAAGDGPPWQPR
jgi:2-dehydropantoate 2-reductase